MVVVERNISIYYRYDTEKPKLYTFNVSARTSDSLIELRFAEDMPIILKNINERELRGMNYERKSPITTLFKAIEEEIKGKYTYMLPVEIEISGDGIFLSKSIEK